MVCRKKEKTLALILVVLLMVVSFFDVDYNCIGVASSCSIAQRIAYSFFHASIIHAGLNLWCFLSIVFLFNVRLWHLAVAYAIAVAVPPFALTEIPTVGLSAVCFTLLGMICVQVQRKVYYNIQMAIYLIVGYFVPNINGEIHICSYIVGLIVGCLSIVPRCLRK